MAVSHCPRPTCNGIIVFNQCNKCGAFSYVGKNEGVRLASGRGVPAPPTRPAPAVPYRPLRLMTNEQWRLLTRLTWYPRSVRLKVIDRSLLGYETDKGEGAFLRVQGAFDDWVASKGGMDSALRSKRNHSGAVNYLVAQLAGEPVRVPGDMPAFIEAGMEDARLGVVYLFGQTRVKPNYFSLGLRSVAAVAGGALQFAELGGDDVDLQVLGDQLLSGAPTQIPPEATAQQVSALNKSLTGLIHKIVSGIGESMPGIDLWDLTGTIISMLKSLVKTLVNIFLKAAAPFVAGGMEIVGGVVKFGEAVVNLVKSWIRGRGVEFMPGHPSIVVDSLRWSMGRSLFQGLYEVIKGAASIAVDVIGGALTTVTAGVSEIVAKVVSILYGVMETLVKVAYRLVETLSMDKFCRTARGHWENRAESNAIHKSPTLFNRWYKRNAMAFPALAALTLNSGMCGDKMRFLRMFKDDDTIITQSQFDKGVKFIDGDLKPYARGYLDDTGFGFRSENAGIQTMIKRETKDTPATTAGKVGKLLLDALKN